MDAKAALSRASEDDLYLGHDNLATKTEWKMGGAGAGNQDVLTDKAGNPRGFVCGGADSYPSPKFT
ncbi:hypothetical protein FS749_016617 [Ceratobasidium sp. UAMH 11750]|nr:hypothetical protein FS749_016617 [Ceratobasidium sp. UAMH 11750]